jgi:hypothetical protein
VWDHCQQRAYNNTHYCNIGVSRMNGSGNGATAGLTSLRAPFGLHQLLLGNLALAVTQHMTAKVPLAVVKAASALSDKFSAKSMR